MTRKFFPTSLLLLSVLAACKHEDAAAQQTVAQPAAAPQAASEAPKPRAATAEFPVLKLKAVDGSDYDLAAHKGHWVVVNFWATWCAPCLKEMPDLDALDKKRKDIDLVGLAYDDISVDDMKEFLVQHPVSYPIVIVDTISPPADFAVPRGLPTTYLIAPDGKALKPFLGPVTSKEIEDTIAAQKG